MTPAIRLNDTTDIWSARGGRYKEEPSRHHRTARVDQAQKHADLGLYSVTFSNQRDIDAENAEAYTAFRADATSAGMRHFLEVFNPAFDIRLKDNADIGSFINDNIVRTLAGVMEADYPKFLKLQYNGPRAMEELASYDPGHLIVGILGGAAGTARDTFELLSQAEKYGARVALFGRKIHRAEQPHRDRPHDARSGGPERHAGGGGEGLSWHAAEGEDQAGPPARRRSAAHRGAAEDGGLTHPLFTARTSLFRGQPCDAGLAASPNRISALGGHCRGPLFRGFCGLRRDLRMLQPPDIELADIAAVLRAAYGVRVNDIVFLPVGADPDAAAWRVTIAGGPPFFLKTKFGPFDRAVLAVPRLLHDAGIREVLAPLLTRDGALSVAAGGTTLILYPYVEGRNGFDVTLTPKSWTALGAAIRRIHETRTARRPRR